MKIFIEIYPYPKDRLSEGLQSAAQMLGIKFLYHLLLGSADCEDGRAFVSVTESINGQRGGRA